MHGCNGRLDRLGDTFVISHVDSNEADPDAIGIGIMPTACSGLIHPLIIVVASVAVAVVTVSVRGLRHPGPEADGHVAFSGLGLHSNACEHYSETTLPKVSTVKTPLLVGVRLGRRYRSPVAVFAYGRGRLIRPPLLVDLLYCLLTGIRQGSGRLCTRKPHCHSRSSSSSLSAIRTASRVLQPLPNQLGPPN